MDDDGKHNRRRLFVSWRFLAAAERINCCTLLPLRESATNTMAAAAAAAATAAKAVVCRRRYLRRLEYCSATDELLPWLRRSAERGEKKELCDAKFCVLSVRIAQLLANDVSCKAQK